MLVHKAKSNELPASINKLFKNVNSQNYNLRSNGNGFLLQKPKKIMWKKVLLIMDQ